MKIPNILKNISKKLKKSDLKAIVVGGSVRDHFLKKKSKDFDIEVYGAKSLNELEELLKEYGKVNLVGKSFGVLKLTTSDGEFDFSLPRVETKVGAGHRGFKVECDGKLSFKEAFKRRDFTINAIGYDIEEKRFIDIYGGIEDIKRGILREVDSKSFVEDPLRVYRAMQFSARFGFKISDSLDKLCKKMVDDGSLDELPKERVFEEFKKLLLKADKPSNGFYHLRRWGALKRYFLELYNLIGLKQDPFYHPEGDVFTHTMLAVDALKKKDLVLKLAVLCHDMGKAVTTKVVDGRIRSMGHEEAGVEIAKSFLKRLSDEKKLIDRVLPLVRYHFVPTAFYKKAKSAAIKRLALKVNIKELVEVAKADFLGRGDENKEYEAGEWLLKKAESLKVKDEPIKPLVSGKDLIKLGFEPSPKMGEILKRLYDLQLKEGIEDKRVLLEKL